MSCDVVVTIARCGDSRHRVREAELSRVRVERSRADRSPQTDSPAMVGSWMAYGFTKVYSCISFIYALIQ